MIAVTSYLWSSDHQEDVQVWVRSKFNSGNPNNNLETGLKQLHLKHSTRNECPNLSLNEAPSATWARDVGWGCQVQLGKALLRPVADRAWGPTVVPGTPSHQSKAFCPQELWASFTWSPCKNMLVEKESPEKKKICSKCDTCRYYHLRRDRTQVNCLVQVCADIACLNPVGHHSPAGMVCPDLRLQALQDSPAP